MSINLASSQSAIVTDSYGVSHLVWADTENGYIWHAVYDSNSETWKDSETVAFAGNEPVTNLNIVANDKLIDGKNPGLAVVWQQGNLNDSDFYYTAARYDENADLQWLDTSQALTSDQVGDLEPNVTVNSSGEVIVVGSKVNFDNVANLSIKEDTDFYSQKFSVTSSQFSTSTSTITPNAPYSPQLTTDGLVNLGVLASSTPATPTTQVAVQSSNESLVQSLATLSSETEEQPGQEAVGSWNAQLFFASSLLEDWELMHSVPQDGFLRKIIEPFMENWELVGTISGGTNFGWGDSESSIFLKTNAQLEWKPKKKSPTVNYNSSEIFGNLFEDDSSNVPKAELQSPISFGFDLDSTYNFDANSPYDLINVDDVLSLSASVKFPIISAIETAGFFSLDATGSLGISFNFLGKAIEGETYSPQTLLAGIDDLEVPIVGGGFADGGILLLNLAREGTTEGSAAGIIAADIAINVADTFAAFLNGTLQGLEPNGSISFPVLSTGLVGKAQIPHVPILSADINGGVRTAFNWGIGDTDNTISLTFPIGFEVKIGPVGLGVNFNPGWYWDILDGNKNEESISVSSQTDSYELSTQASIVSTQDSGLSAQVSGSLITVNFETTLSTIPEPKDFTVTTTDINGNITNIPVFNVIQGNSDNSLILQLESSIPISENLDYTSSDNPQPTSNAVTLSFTNNDNITDSEGNPLANINSIAVNNVTPNSLAYNYNPISGNSQNYINPTLLLAFNTPLDTNINPDLERFTVKENNTSLSVESATVTNNGVLLTFASSVTNQSLQNVSISYNNNSSLGDNPLQDSGGNEIESFTIQNGLTTEVSQSFVVINNTNQNLTLSDTVADYSITVTNSDGTTVNNVTVESVSITGEDVILNLNQSISPDQTVSIRYNNQNISNSLVTGITPPAVTTQFLMANIEADLGQDSNPVIVSGGSSPLLAWVAEVPPLEAISGFVNNQTIILNFIDELGNGTNVPNTNQFIVSDSNNNTYTVTNVSTSGDSIVLTLNKAVSADTDLNISYSLSTPSGNNNNLFLDNSFTNTNTNTNTNTKLWINEFSDFALTNTTNNSNPPVILGAGSIVETSSSNHITLVFDQNLTGNGVTNSDFIVESNGQVFAIEANVQVNDNSVILTVQPPEGANLIGNGDIVTVSYTGNSLSSSNGNVINFSNQPVITSPSTPTTVIKYALLNSTDSNLVSNISSILGTGGFNFDPVGAYDSVNNVTVLVWSNADSSDINTNLTLGEFYTDDETTFINESLNQSDIYYSIYNGSSWTIASPIAQQEGSEGKIAIGEGPNNQLMAAWINYNNDESNIYWSSLTYNNGVATWRNPEILYADANPDPLTELSIVTIDGNPTVLWTETQGTSYSQLTQEESPLLYYRLAETSGTTLVNEGIYGAGGNGTYSGSVTFNEVGALENTTTNEGDANSAVLFNSSDSATSVTIPLYGTSFTVEFWFKVPSLPSNTLDLVSANGLMNVTLNNSGLSLNINGSALNSNGFTPSVNEWYYVVATYNGENNTANLYVNGDNVGSLNNVDLTIPSNTSLTLAGSSNDSVYLDEVAFYRQALTYNDTPDISDFGNLTPSQISQLFFNTSQIGNKYDSQYINPLGSGPNTNYVTYNGDSWSVPSIIEPNYKPVATQLSDANKAEWDVTSYTTANSSGYVNPNGNPDIFLSLNLSNQATGNKISSIVVTATNSNGQTITWSVGNTNGNQLAVVQGDKLLNPVNPDGSFDYTILSPSVDLDLFLDAGSNSNLFNFQYSINGVSFQSISTADVTSTSEPTDINSNQVLGIATVTEANDSSLALIDSGFIINTTNPSMGYVITNGDFNNDGKSDVAVGNRGYTNTSGNVLGQGTIQILFGGGAVLSNSETNPLTTTDLSGNPNGVLITGISDTGQANGDYPFSMATGDVNGDGYEDLVIGDPNANKVYVIYGSAMTAGTTIDISTSGSWGYVINSPSSNIGFGYSVAVGNFNSNAQSNGTYASGTKFDIAIGAPGANNGNGAVYVAFDGSSNLSTIYSSSNTGELAGYSLAVSSRTSQAVTFTGNANSDDLIIGAIGYQGTVTNQWNGLDGLPASANNNPNGQSYPSTSSAEIGAVYVYQSNGTETLTEYATYLGSNLPSSNGTANNSNAGYALNSTDLDGDGDGTNDLAISAPGGANNDGLIYVLKGGITKNTNPQNLDTVANLGIVGGLSFSQTGAIITSAGDVNHDKYEDFLITAPQGANGTGQGYVLFGPLNLNDIGTIFDLNVTANDNKTTFLLNGDQPNQLVGAAASNVGDVNGDGVDDLMISAPNAGQLYTIYGHHWLADDGSIKLADISGDNGFVIDGDLYINGYTLGLSDSNTNSTYGINIPVGVLFLLSPTEDVIWQSDNTTPAVQALMQTDGNFVLYSQAQPLNQPGSYQYAVWSTETSGYKDAYLSLAEDGGLYIVGYATNPLIPLTKTINQGSASATNNNTTLQTANQITTNSNTFISNDQYRLGKLGNGNNVVMLGDINGDGFADVLSGGDQYSAVIVFGNSTKNLIDAAVGSDDLIVRVENGEIRQVVSLGDYNGDGLKDFGILGTDNNFYLVFGDFSLGIQGVLEVNTTNNNYVGEVTEPEVTGNVGDYNGDGYSDFLLLDDLFLGNSSGGLGTKIIVQNGDTLMSPLGDINGDGYSDLGLGNENANFNSINSAGNGQFTVSLGNNKGTSTINPPDAVFEQDLNNSEWTSQYSIGGQSAKLAPTLVEFNGYLYMLYNATDSANGNNNTLWMQKSADGVNWEGLTNLGSSFETYYQPSLAVFDNTLYLAFTATNNEIILASAVTDDSDLGLTFNGGEFYQIAGNTSKNGPTLVAYNNNNNNELYTFFIANNSNDTIIYVTSSDPSNSSSWSSNNTVPYNGGNNSTDDRIGAAVLNDDLYIAFKGSSNNSINVTYYNGTSWSSANNSAGSQVISGQSTTAGPSLIATDETLYLFYKSSASDESIYYTYGDNWDNDEYIPNQSSFDRTSPAFFNQSIYIAHVGYNFDQTIYVTASNPIFEPNISQQLGSQLQGIGDFNGDGIEDYGVLAPGYATLGELNSSNYFENNQGALFIYYGSTSDINSTSTPDVVLNPQYSSSNSTIYNLSNFTAIGDVNGDGYDDVAISSPTTSLTSENTEDGTIFVVFGGANWRSTYSATNPFDLNSLSNNQSNSNTDNSNPNGFLITGLPGSQAGISLSGGEDVNGDSFDDFIIGAPGNDDNLTYVIFGSDFNKTATQTGTIGDDVMVGTATGESFLAGEGDDQIYTNGGIDVAYAGLGDDFVTVNDTYFRRLDGGAGTDVLVFEGYNGQDWDLTTLSPSSRLRNFEILVTENYGANTLTLNSLTVTQLSDNNTVTVVMDAQDTLNLSADFSLNGTVYQYNQKFDRYTSNSSGATVLLNRIVGTESSQLVLTEEGSLVLLSADGEQLWTAENNGVQVTDAVQALMQTDGNFVLYSQLQPTNQPGSAQYALWSTHTNGDEGAYLQLGADGGLYIKSSGGNILSTLNSGNSNISNPTVLNQSQELLAEDSLSATETTNLINVTQNAPSDNTPENIVPPEITASSINYQATTFYSVAESNSETTQSFASSVFSATANDENTPTRISVSNPTANEADGEIEFVIQRTGNLSKYVQVSYLSQDGRGKAGNDYLPVYGKAVFAPEETTKTVKVKLPLDDIYTGTRDFGLLVTLEQESIEPIDEQYHIYVDPEDEQIRIWNHQLDSTLEDSLTKGNLEFRTTTTDGKADIKIYFDNGDEYNDFFIFNPQKGIYESYKFDDTEGAKFFDEDGDGNFDGVVLHLQESGKADIDGVNNGLVHINGYFTYTEPPIEIPKVVFGTARDDYFDSAFPDSKNFVGNEQTLFTGSGDDTVDVSQVGRKNRIDTGSGDDIVFAGTRNRIILGAGDDILFAGSGRGANRITLGAGKDQLWLTEDDRSIPRNPNQVSDFNPDDDVIGFANTVLSLGNKGDLWDYQQVGNDVMISAFGQEIAQLLNTTVTDSSFVFA